MRRRSLKNPRDDCDEKKRHLLATWEQLNEACAVLPQLRSVIAQRPWKEFRAIVQKLGPTNDEPKLPVLMALAFQASSVGATEAELLNRLDAVLQAYECAGTGAAEDAVHRLAAWSAGHAGIVSELETFLRLNAAGTVRATPRAPPGPDFSCAFPARSLSIEVKTLDDLQGADKPLRMGDASVSFSGFRGDSRPWAHEKLRSTCKRVREQARREPDSPTVAVLVNRTFVAKRSLDEAWDAMRVNWIGARVIGYILVPTKSEVRVRAAPGFEHEVGLVDTLVRDGAPHISRMF
ncbi:MAG: hypothetical protein IT453_02130 [Planctomycetes bacterium]|nr:hypothetical protein [Planctomycetota bacterium]